MGQADPEAEGGDIGRYEAVHVLGRLLTRRP